MIWPRTSPRLLSQFQLIRGTANPTKSYVRPVKTQISLSAHSDQSLLGVLWVVKDPVLPHADSESSNQTARMHRVI